MRLTAIVLTVLGFLNASATPLGLRIGVWDAMQGESDAGCLSRSASELLNAESQTFTAGGDLAWFGVAESHDGEGSMRSGRIGDNQSSWIETTISGQGRISFWWKASCEEYDGDIYDYGYLSVDGVPQGTLNDYRLEGIAIGGQTDWTNIVLDVVGEGAHTIRWTYRKDETNDTTSVIGEDCIWLDEFSFLPKPTISFGIGTNASGDAPDSIQDFRGTNITLPSGEGFYWADHVFDGWTDGISDYSAGTSFEIPSSNVTFTAKWIAKSFVSFDIGGGEGSQPDLIKALPNAIVALPSGEGFSWSDHVFNGWTDGVNDYSGGANYTVPSSNVTFIAKWIAKSFVSFDIGAGTGETPETIKDVPNSIVTLPMADGFEWTDHVFNSWSDGHSVYLAGADYIVPSSNVTLTARWIAKSFVSFDIGGGMGEAPQTIKALPNERIALPTGDGLAMADYAFGGWSDGARNYVAGGNYTVPSANVTLTAIWIAKRFLTFTLDGGEGEIPIAIKDVPNATVTLPSGEGLSKPRHTFAGWSDGARTYEAGAEYVVTDSSVEFTAVWTANTLDAPLITSADVANGGTIATASATIEITADTGTVIYYTTDETEPTTNSIVYTGAFVVDGLTNMIRAIATKDNCFDSDVAEFAFTRYPYSAAECLNAGGKTISTGIEDAAWVRVLGEAAHDGIAALRSGAIGDGESSTIEMAVEGQGNISFLWKVSSEISHSRKFDYVSFLIDGVEKKWIGGETEWARVNCTIDGRGTHTLKWVYQKNSNGQTQGEDCAWLDEVTWTHASWPIRFRANGGRVDDERENSIFVEDSKSIAETIDELPVATRLGYRFLGWFTETDGGRMIDTHEIITASVTFFAHWESTDEGIVADGIRWFYTERDDLGGLEITGIDNANIPKNLVIPDELLGERVVSIGRHAFSPWYSQFGYETITNVVLNAGLVELGYGAFDFCLDLRSVVVPGSVKTISAFAFNECSRLECVELGEGVSTLSTNCFARCVSLSKIELPSSLTNLERSAFQECFGLDTMIFMGGRPTLSSSVSAVEGDDGIWGHCSDYTLSQVFVMDDIGWRDGNGQRLETWHEKLVVFAPYPFLGDNPTPSQIAGVLEYSMDERITSRIINGSDYNSYRTWVDRVCGTDFSKRESVENSDHAWLSFALDANVLIADTPKQGDLRIDGFKASATSGAFDFEISIEGITVGEEATATNLAEIFGIEGAEMPNGDYTSNDVELTFGTPANGKVKCTARPKDATKTSFFMKVKMNP